MTIERGKSWGSSVERPITDRVANSDADIVQWWSAAPAEPIVLTGGDLFRALGSPPTRDPAMLFPIDLIEVTTDEGTLTAASHVVVRHRWWRGRIIGVFNSDYLGDWNVAPRAHPNDGKLDIIEVAPTMNWRQRWQARQRLATGTHVPHPSITMVRKPAASFEFAHPTPVWIDGQPHRPTGTLNVTVLPDAALVIA